MTPTRWERVQELLNAALDLPPGERLALLARECSGDPDLRRQVEVLLQSDEEVGGFFERAIEAGAHGMLAAGSPLEGERLGPYQLAESLGHGGMGTVYRATRADDQYHQQVAIKVVRADIGNSPALLSRFRAERQILATLTHPNIARLLDGGITAAGLPYLVMEYVDGVTIDRFVADQHLPIRQRLTMFRSLCAAVQYAHQNLVVHRDIKPANVLVTSDGTPKLLDFGIAKLLAPTRPDQTIIETRVHDRLMTPQYASPEQIRGETVTTATDVYGLGVLLYELLTGERPFLVDNLTPAALERLICETPPERPSTRDRKADTGNAGAAEVSHGPLEKISSDLDNIVLKAMHKEPARRYSSAAELAEDVRRFQEGFPITARPDSWRYRTRKFIGRHKVGTAATALFAITTVGLSIGLAVQAERAKRQSRTAQQVSEFLASLFRTSRPDERQGRSISARDILDRGAERISKELSGEPEAQGRLLDTIGNVYYTLGATDRAEPLLEQAYTLDRRTLGAESEESVGPLMTLALIAQDRGDLDLAAKRMEESLRIYTKRRGRNDPDVATILNNIGLLRWHQGDFASAIAHEKESMAINERLRGPDHSKTLTSKNNLETILADSGDYRAAEPLAREVLATRLRTLGPDHPHVAVSLNNLCFLQIKMARLKDAEATARQALDLRRKLLGAEHPEVAMSLNMLSWILWEEGRYPEAVELSAQGFTMIRKLSGSRSLSTAMHENQYGLSLMKTGDLVRARELMNSALAARSALVKPGHPHLAMSYDSLGLLELAEHHNAAAEQQFRKALGIREKFFGPESVDRAMGLTHLAEALAAKSDTAQAEQTFREALRIARARLGDTHTLTAEALFGLGQTLVAEGKKAEARPLLADSLQVRRQLLAAEHPDVAASAKALGNL